MFDLLPRFDLVKAIGDLQAVGVTQTAIADEIEVTQGRISQIVNGVGADSLKYEKRVKLYNLCLKHAVKILVTEQ